MFPDSLWSFFWGNC